MSTRRWGGKMKWMIFRELDQLTLMASDYECEHEYQYWKFISNDFKWVFNLYISEGTELHDIVKTFTEDDMYDLRDYLLYKEYDAPFELVDGMTLAEAHDKFNDFTYRILSDFVYGDKSYTTKENNKDTIYTINDSWNKGNIRLSISKIGTDTTVGVYSHDLNDNVPGKVLLDNLLFATGDNLGKYNYVTVKSLNREYSMLENSFEEVIEKWDKDESVKVISISKTINDYLNIDQLLFVLHNENNNYEFEKYIVEGKR